MKFLWIIAATKVISGVRLPGRVAVRAEPCGELLFVVCEGAREGISNVRRNFEL